jgi:hypothetical protein
MALYVPPDIKLISLHLFILCVSNNYRDKRPIFPCAVLTDCLSQTKRRTLSVKRWKLVVYLREMKWWDLDHEKNYSHVSSVRTGLKETLTRLLSPITEWLLEGAEVWLHLFVAWALDGDEWPTSRMGRFTFREDPGGHWIVGLLMGYRISLDVWQERIISCIYRGSKAGSSTSYPIFYRLRCPGASRKPNVLFLTDLYIV